MHEVYALGALNLPEAFRRKDSPRFPDPQGGTDAALYLGGGVTRALGDPGGAPDWGQADYNPLTRGYVQDPIKASANLGRAVLGALGEMVIPKNPPRSSGTPASFLAPMVFEGPDPVYPANNAVRWGLSDSMGAVTSSSLQTALKYAVGLAAAVYAYRKLVK